MASHFLIPFAIESGSAMTVDQGTQQEIIQSVTNLVGTRPGTRLMSPSYGIPDPTFEGIDPVALRLAVAKWEKRASVFVQSSPGNEETVIVSVAT